MRYYIDGLLNININELAEYLYKQYDEKIILANDGYYKYINNELYKFKLSNSNDNKDLFIPLEKNIKIIGTNVYWKKYDKVHKIPFHEIRRYICMHVGCLSESQHKSHIQPITLEA